MTEQIALYDPDAIRAALDADASGVDGFVGPADERPQQTDDRTFSVEETQWRRTLRRIADDPRGPLRKVLVGTSEMAARVADLDLVAPHFAAVTRLVLRAVVASARTGTRLRVPQICLLGPPGIGKTFYAKRLAKAFGDVHFVELAMNMLNDRGRVSGFSMSWRGARMGDLARGVLAGESRTSGPLFFFDEIDKVDPQERLHDVLLSVLESENAAKFVDEYLSVFSLRLDHAQVLATANDLTQVPAPLTDRMLVVDVAAPTGDDLRAVIRSVYAAVAETYGPRFCPFVDERLVRRLAAMPPRRMRRTLELAAPVAIEAGRWSLAVCDLEAACAIVEEAPVRGIGFLK